MDKPSNAPKVQALGSASASEKWYCPGEDGWPPVDEYLDEPEVTDHERLGGRRLRVSPASPEHAKPHFRLDYLIGAHLRDGYEGASDLKTRVSREDELASDTCVLRKGVDPSTGRRYLEELAFEVVYKRSSAEVKKRANAFAARGVRRQIAIFVQKGEVCEWDASENEWRRLEREHRIHDKCLARPLEVAALLDAADVDVAVALALEAKGNPAIVRMKDESRRQGREEGRSQGQAKLVLRQAERRFGKLDEAVRRRIETADEDTLLVYADRILTARKVSDLF